MKIKINELYIFITILLLTLSHCVAFVGTPVEAIIEYAGYILLLGGILLSYFRTSRTYRRKNTTKMVFLLLILMLPGILMQHLPTTRKMTIILTILAIIIVSVMSEKFLKNYHLFRVMAYACVVGIVMSMFISVISGVPIIRYTSEPVFGMIYYFNGGIRDKNVATMMIAIMISIYIDSHERNRFRNIDKLTIGISLIVLFVANSRGAWIEFVVFMLMLNYRKIENITKAHRGVFIVSVVLVITPLVVTFYNRFIMQSETYLFRYRGLMNYITKFAEDDFHMIFGNAEMAYGSGQDYAIAVRSVTGWNGTIENAWLNILIKSGILGIIGYIILFVRAIITAIRCENILYKTIYLSVTITLIVSSFAAIYIQTIHGLFGIYCYLIMAYYSGKIRENNYYHNKQFLRIRSNKIGSVTQSLDTQIV